MNEKNQYSLLEQRLRSEPPRFSARPGFTKRVMDNLPARVNRSHAPVFIPWQRFILALAAAACIALVLTQLLPRDVRPIQSTAESQPGSSVPVKIPNISMTQVQDLVAKLDEPLETELKNVISDTRQAIQFVASNFLPEN